MTANSQHKFLPPLADDPEHGILPVADRDPVGFFLGREVPPGVVEPAGRRGAGQSGPPAAWGRSNAPYRIASFSEISPFTAAYDPITAIAVRSSTASAGPFATVRAGNRRNRPMNQVKPMANGTRITSGRAR